MFELLAVVAIIGYLIARQLMGEPQRGKRLIVLPAAVAVIGLVDLAGQDHQAGTTDLVVIIVGALLAGGIGIAQGSMMRLEARAGTLWGRMPLRSLWLWLALALSRVVIEVVASGLGARVAAGTAAILLTLGVNRLAQAGVIALRALAAGIPLSPERDGSTFLAQVLGAGEQRSFGDQKQ